MLVFRKTPDSVAESVATSSERSRALENCWRSTQSSASRHRVPAFVTLAADEGLASLSLCIKGIEGLFQPLLRGLPCVDGTTQSAFRFRAHCPSTPVLSGRSPLIAKEQRSGPAGPSDQASYLREALVETAFVRVAICFNVDHMHLVATRARVWFPFSELASS